MCRISTHIVLFPEVRLFVARDRFRLTGALRGLRQDGRRGGTAEVTQQQHGEEVGHDIGDVREEDETCDKNNKDVRTRNVTNECANVTNEQVNVRRERA